MTDEEHHTHEDTENRLPNTQLLLQHETPVIQPENHVLSMSPQRSPSPTMPHHPMYIQQQPTQEQFIHLPPLPMGIHDHPPSNSSLTETPKSFVQDHCLESNQEIPKEQLFFPPTQTHTNPYYSQRNHTNDMYLPQQLSGQPGFPQQRFIGYTNIPQQNSHQSFLYEMPTYIPAIITPTNTSNYPGQILLPQPQPQPQQLQQQPPQLHQSSQSQQYIQQYIPPYQHAFPNYQDQFGPQFKSLSAPLPNYSDLMEDDYIRHKRKYKLWSEEEDMLLYDLKKVKMMSWKDIALKFPDRTLHACQFRWRKLCTFINDQKHLNIVQEQSDKSQPTDIPNGIAHENALEVAQAATIPSPQQEKQILCKDSSRDTYISSPSTVPLGEISEPETNNSLRSKRLKPQALPTESEESDMETRTQKDLADLSPKSHRLQLYNAGETSEMVSVMSANSNISSVIGTPRVDQKRTNCNIRDILN